MKFEQSIEGAAIRCKWMPCPLLHLEADAMDDLVKGAAHCSIPCKRSQEKSVAKMHVSLFDVAIRSYYLSSDFRINFFCLKGVFSCRHTGSVFLRF